MSEMKERVTFKCARELALQIEEKCAEFDGKYVLNHANMEKFSKVYDFFYAIADEDGGEVRCFDVHPESERANVSIEVSLVDLYKDTLNDFVDILQYVDVLEIKPTTDDGLQIDAGVNGVWEVAE